MYAAHFGLANEPFSLTPDPFFLYPSPSHAEALAALKVGLLGRRGLLVMIGEVGTGKTTLLYTLLSELGQEVRTAYISNTRLSFEDMLRQALADFGVAAAGDSRAALLAALNAFLARCAAEDRTAALIIDEAQNLSDETFENLRLLSNYETFDRKLLQIVLVGQPELEARLRNPHIRQIAERVAVRCYVNPLGWKESREYIRHRLARAGGSLELLTPAALRLVQWKSRGLPRRINIICHNAFLFAYGHDARRVTWHFVRAAVREREGRGLVQMRGPLARRLDGALGRRPGRIGTVLAGAALSALIGVAAVRWIDRPASVTAPQTMLQIEPSLRRLSVGPDMAMAETQHPLATQARLELETSYRRGRSTERSS